MIRANPRGSADGLANLPPFDTIAHSHNNIKVKSLRVLACPLVIEKSNLGNHPKHCSVIKNTVRMNKIRVSGVRI